jgi:hypothetical protein
MAKLIFRGYAFEHLKYEKVHGVLARFKELS